MTLISKNFFSTEFAPWRNTIKLTNYCINDIDKILHLDSKEYEIILVPPYQNYRIKLSNSKNADLMRKIESMLECIANDDNLKHLLQQKG